MNKVPRSSQVIIKDTTTTIKEDADGNLTQDTTEKTRTLDRTTEPDYIKLYTNVWCEFNEIPLPYRPLFLELASRMSYADKSDLKTSQTVYVGKPYSDSILKKLGWTNRDSLTKGLKILCERKAIKRVAQAVYQINPSYAGRGEWRYNPKLERGGVEDLVAEFNFVTGEINTRIRFATADPEITGDKNTSVVATQTKITPTPADPDPDEPAEAPAPKKRTRKKKTDEGAAE